MRQVIIFFLLFFLPFVVLPFGVTPFETPKIIVAEGSILLLTVITFYKENLKKFFLQKQFIPLGIVFVLTFLHLIFRQSETLFLGNAFRMQGVFLLWVLLIFSIISFSIKLPRVSSRMMIILLIVHFLLAFLITGSNEDRAIGTLGEPNALAASLLFLWPFLIVGKTVSRKSFILQQVGLLITGIIILASGSRSGMVAFGIQVVFLVLYTYLRFPLKRALCIVLLLFMMSLSLPFLDRNTMYERRDDIWKASLLSGYEYPILGWGFGNTEKALEKYNDRLYNTAHGYYVDSSHNVFLDWWVQGGIIGLSVFVLLLYQAGRKFLQAKKVVYLMIFIGIITALSFNPVSIVSLIQFWWLIGVSLKE